MARYRSDGERGAQRRSQHAARVRTYQKANPEKRRRWVRAWREHTGGAHVVKGAVYFYPTEDLNLLRRAVKRLEQAVAEAEQREGIGRTDERRRDDGAER